MAASYLYSGIDSESQTLNAELQRLGGGDARISAMEVHCVIDERKGDEAQTLWNFGNAVGVRDVQAGVHRCHAARVGTSVAATSLQ